MLKEIMHTFWSLMNVGLKVHHLVFIVFIQLLAFALGIMLPVQFRDLIQQYVNGSEWSILYGTGFVVLALIALKTLVQIADSLYINTLQAELLKNLRIRLYDTFAAMPYDHFITRKPEEVSTVADQYAMSCLGFFTTGSLLSIYSLSIFSALIAAFMLSPVLAMLMVLITPLYIKINRRVAVKQRGLGQLTMQATTRLNAETLYQTRSISSIRLNHAQFWHVEQFEELIQDNRKVNRNQGMGVAQSTVETDLLILGYFGLILGMGLFLVLNKMMGLDVFIALLPILASIATPLRSVASRWIGLNSTLPRVLSVLDVLETPVTHQEETVDVTGVSISQIKLAKSEVAATSISNEHLLEVQNLSFRYPGNDELTLRGLSFALREGEFVAVVGPSGAGKSTLFYLLAGLFAPTNGQIYLKPEASVGVVSQVPFLFNGTVGENVLLGRGSSIQAKEALLRAQLSERIHDLDIPIIEQGKNFSLGEKQRVGIARTLVTEHALLLMDEPGANLDVATHERMMNIIQSLRNSQTILMIAHRVETLKNADRILVLKGGELEAVGTWEELSQSSVTFQAVLKAMGGEKAC